MELSSNLKPAPSFYVSLGDCVAGSGDNEVLKEQLLDFKSVCKQFVSSILILPVLGNHEVNNVPVDTSSEVIFKEQLLNFRKMSKLEGYNDTVYHMDLDNCRFIFLNTYHCGELKKIENEQLKWLEATCKTDKKYKFVFMHDPAFPTGAHIGTCLDSYPEARDRLWKVIDENNINIVFNGHEHNYSRRIIDCAFSNSKYEFKNKVYQIISGGGGEKLRDSFKSRKGVIVAPKARYHFVVVDINEDSVVVEVVSTEGKSLDKFTV